VTPLDEAISKDEQNKIASIALALIETVAENGGLTNGEFTIEFNNAVIAIKTALGDV